MGIFTLCISFIVFAGYGYFNYRSHKQKAEGLVADILRSHTPRSPE